MQLATTALFVLSGLLAPVSVDGVEGRWTLEIPEPGVVELNRLQLELKLEGTEVHGTLFASAGTVSGVGTWEADAGRVRLELQIAPNANGVFTGELRDDRLVGTFELLGSLVSIEAERWSAAEEENAPPIVVDFAVEPPVTVSQAGLADGLDIQVMEAIDRVYRSARAVGLSAAIVIDGELADVRSFGWADFPARTPATGETMYRWASIAKPLTAVAAHQLFAQGVLDLDTDVRQYVPEFPEKAWPFTARQLLCHQAGVVHYRNMGLRTLRDYDVEHPWADPILALDMFNERELLFEPGTQYHYTTPGFVILGAVIDRAGEGSYVEQVTQRICEPLGMSTMQPDREWVDIPHRTRGYVQDDQGRVVDSGTDNICWKLAAGGWISTVGDLGRFGAGLMDGDLLGLEQQIAMWTEQTTGAGERTGYGLGIGVGEVAGRMALSHSGGQKKTSTFLLVCPEERVAVALMCNTQGTPLGGLAQELLGLLIEASAR
jgi:CubicO group peptidase (beta-lactamase class C family)